jgi:hypothetical protein
VSERLALGRAGDQLALETLVPFVYKELRDIACHRLQLERPRDTLQNTRLVREGYLRLVSQTSFKVENGGHFPGVASHLVGQILGEYARSHAAARRGAEQEVDFDADCSWSADLWPWTKLSIKFLVSTNSKADGREASLWRPRDRGDRQRAGRFPSDGQA